VIKQNWKLIAGLLLAGWPLPLSIWLGIYMNGWKVTVIIYGLCTLALETVLYGACLLIGDNKRVESAQAETAPPCIHCGRPMPVGTVCTADMRCPKNNYSGHVYEFTVGETAPQQKDNP
jgi:hypothetical protein